MLCTNCKKENAVFFYQQNINGNSTSVALCKNCSKKFNSPSENFGFFEPFFGSPSKNHAENKVCNLCGLSFGDIKKLGKVGCPECYKTFKDELSVIIKQIHGGAKHCGSPSNTFEEKNDGITQVELLQKQLENAIKDERYEEAATLRDKIKELKGESI